MRRSTLTGRELSTRRQSRARRGAERLEERGLLSVSVLDVSMPKLTRDAIVATGEPDRFVFTITEEMGGGSFSAEVISTSGSLIPRLTLTRDAALLTQSDSGMLHVYLTPGSYELSVSSQVGLGDYELSTRFTPTSEPHSPVLVGKLPRSVATGDLNGDGFADVVTTNAQGGSVTTALGNGDGTFQASQEIVTGTAVDVALADLNGDGLLDVVLPLRGYDAASVLLGNGDGTFQTGRRIAAGERPGGVAVGDFDRDGKLDVVVSNYAGHSLSVLMGSGDGNLSAHSTLPTALGPGRVVATDIDGDGFLDLLVPSYTEGTLSVFRGDGTGSFADPLLFEAGASPYSMKVSDVNGDGLKDAVVVNYSSNKLVLLLGKGNADFEEPRILEGGLGVYGVEVADVNGDGFVDFVTANFSDNTAGVLLGEGNGNFRSPMTFAAGNGAGAIAVADFDRDGRLDVVTADLAENTASVLLGRGDGTFIERTATIPNLRQYSIVPADLNGDGLEDAVVSNKGTDSISVLLKNLDGSFQRRQSYPTVAKPNTATIGDINGDGFLDLVTSSYIDAEIGIHFGRGDGTFDELQRFDAASTSYQVEVADVNGDGFDDVLTAANNNSLEVFLSDGVGGVDESRSFPSGRGNTSVALRDLNGDGRIDAALANFRDDAVSVLLGNGDGSFETPTAFEVGTLPNVAVLVDVNQDGSADIVTVNSEATVSVLLNDGHANFAPQQKYFVGDPVGEIAPADFNADGFIDFVVSSTRSRSGALLLGRGDGTFDVTTQLPLGVEAGGVAVLDVNADGHQDVLTVDYKTDATATLVGRGDGTFESAVVEPIGKKRHAVRTVDVNDDGKLDALTTNLQSNSVSVSLGTGTGSFVPFGTVDVGVEPTGIATGDFNFDGRLDLAIVNSVSNSISVAIGNGDGSFNAGQTLAVGVSPRVIVTADIDGDGASDLIVSNYNDATVSVLMGRPDGTFAAPRNFSVGLRPYDITAADFDGDGRVDLAVGNVAENSVSLLYGKRDGGFESAISVAVGRQPIAVAVGDFNADGRPDLATAGAVDRAVDVLFGQAGRQFSLPQSVNGSETVAGSLEAADVDGDGAIDLVLANLSEQSVDVLFGVGDGSFLTPQSQAEDTQPTQTVVADINQDGRLDLLTVNGQNNEIGVWQNVGQRTFAAASPATDVGQLTTPQLVDLNGDGLLDRIVLDGAGRIQFRAGLMTEKSSDATTAFAPPIVLNPDRTARDFTIVRTGNDVAVAAVDTRFDPELSDALIDALSEPSFESTPVVSNTSASDFIFAVSLYDVDLETGVARRTAFSTAAAASRLLAADLNGDGWDELIAANALDRSLSIARQISPGQFADPVSVPVGNAPSGIAVGDVNLDGLLDVLVSNQGSGDLSVALNDAAFAFDEVLRFGAATTLPSVETVLDDVVLNSIAESVSLTVGDFTSDGLNDAVVVNRGTHSFSVLVGNGRGGFENPRTELTTSTSLGFDINSRPGPIVSGDFNRDGKLDAAVLMEDSGQLWIFDGHDDGTFENSFRIAVGDQARGLSKVAGTRAGFVDLLVGNGFGDVLHLEGKGDGTFQIRGKRVSLSVVPDLLGPGQAGVLVGNQEDNRVTVQTRTSDTDEFDAVQTLGDGVDSQLAPGDVLWTTLQRGSSLPSAVVVSTGGNAVIVYHTTSVTSGAPVFDDSPQTYFVGTAPTSVTVQDINADSVPDMLVANSGSNDVSVLFGSYDDAGVWHARSGPRLRSGGTGPLAVTVRDLDGDQIADLAVTNGSSGTVTALSGVGQGFFDDRRPDVLLALDSTLNLPPTFAPGGSIGFAVLTSGDVVRFDLEKIASGARVIYAADSVVAARALSADRVVIATSSGSVRVLRSDGSNFVVESELKSDSNDALSPSSLAILPTASGGFQVLVTSQGSDSVTVFSQSSSVGPLVPLSTINAVAVSDSSAFSLSFAPIIAGSLSLDVGLGLSLAAFSSQLEMAFSTSSTAALVAVEGDSYSTVAVLDFGSQQDDSTGDGRERDPSLSRRHSFGDQSPVARFVIGVGEAVEEFRRELEKGDSVPPDDEPQAGDHEAVWEVDLFQPVIPRTRTEGTTSQGAARRPMSRLQHPQPNRLAAERTLSGVLDRVWLNGVDETEQLKAIPAEDLEPTANAPVTRMTQALGVVAGIIPLTALGVTLKPRPRRRAKS